MLDLLSPDACVCESRKSSIVPSIGANVHKLNIVSSAYLIDTSVGGIVSVLSPWRCPSPEFPRCSLGRAVVAGEESIVVVALESLSRCAVSYLLACSPHL